MSRSPPDNPEINEATTLLHEDCVIDAELYAIGGAAAGTDEYIYEPTDIDYIIETLFSAWLQVAPSSSGNPEREDSEFFGQRALHAMSTAWRQIKAERDALPESEVIVQGLTESMVDYMHMIQLVVPDGEQDAMKKDFTANLTEIVAERCQQILDAIEEEDAQERARKKNEPIYGPQTDTDNIIETLFLAWLQFPPSRSGNPEHEDSELLGPRALHAMSTAWRQIKAERDALPESEVIVQGLVESMVDYMYRLDDGDVTKEAFTAHVTQIVAEGWQQILDGIEEEDAQERARKERERRQRINKRKERRQEIAEVLWFYEPFGRMNHHVPLDCRLCCINICACCSVLIFQVLISTLLLAWTLSIGIMGGLYMTQCPMSYLMPYVMMAIGVAGAIALLTRMSFAIYEKIIETQIRIWCPSIVLKVIEFVLLVFIVIHLYCFFTKTPSFVPGSPEYCNETFYNFVHWINYVSIALASLWLFIYFIKGILTLHLRKFSLRPW